MAKKKLWKVIVSRKNKLQTRSFGTQKTALNFMEKEKKSGRRFGSYFGSGKS